LSYITTESGQRRIDTQPQGGSDKAVIERLDGLERKIKALGEHLGLKGVNA